MWGRPRHGHGHGFRLPTSPAGWAGAAIAIAVAAAFSLYDPGRSTRSDDFRQRAYNRFQAEIAGGYMTTPEIARSMIDAEHDAAFDECYQRRRRRRAAHFDEPKYWRLMQERIAARTRALTPR